MVWLTLAGCIRKVSAAPTRYIAAVIENCHPPTTGCPRAEEPGRAILHSCKVSSRTRLGVSSRSCPISTESPGQALHEDWAREEHLRSSIDTRSVEILKPDLDNTDFAKWQGVIVAMS
jgi:hypothetical protein